MKSSTHEIPTFPLLEVFGGLLGVLVLLVALMARDVPMVLAAQLQPEKLQDIHRVDLSTHAEIKLMCNREEVMIADSGQTVPVNELRTEDNILARRLREHRDEFNTREMDVLVVLYPDSNRAAYEVRQMFVRLGIKRFHLLLLNRELMELLAE